MTDIYLCRHGRTQLNVAGRLRGRLDPDLDIVGLAEARDLAEELSRVEPTRVVSSPSRRALETAQPIAEASEVVAMTDDRLLDRAYGQFDGALAADVLDTYGSFDAAPGVEPAATVAARGVELLTELVSGEGGPIVVVSHDAVIRLVLDALVPSPKEFHHIQPRTGCWTLLRHDADGWRLIKANSKDDPIETALAR
jgi:broad specificity phosphatase PhoE